MFLKKGARTGTGYEKAPGNRLQAPWAFAVPPRAVDLPPSHSIPLQKCRHRSMLIFVATF